MPQLNATGISVIVAAEKEKLAKCVERFSSAMRRKLFQKAQEGSCGWDSKQYKENIEKNLYEHVARLKKGEAQEIDIANLAMMLWNLRRIDGKEKA